MLRMHSGEAKLTPSTLNMNVDKTDALAFRHPAIRRFIAGPGTQHDADEEGGLLDLPVNPDEGADQIPEEDRPVPT